MGAGQGVVGVGTTQLRGNQLSDTLHCALVVLNGGRSWLALPPSYQITPGSFYHTTPHHIRSSCCRVKIHLVIIGSWVEYAC
jgi:hypothetical protein